MKQTLFTLIVILITITTNAQVGNSLSTDGVQDYISIPDNDALDLIDHFTVECWIQAKQVDDIVVPFRKGWCNTSDDAYFLSIKDGALRWHWSYSGNCDYNSMYSTIDEVISAGKCTHIAIVHSSSEIKIYIDNVLVSGELINGEYSTINNSEEDLDIAAYKFLSGDYGNYFNGTIDELRFWNYELTQQEIIDYSDSPLTGDETGLIAYFDMEDTGEGTSLTITNKAVASGDMASQAHGSSESPFLTNSCVVTSTNDIISNKDMHIYPNPTENIINIDKSTQGNLLVELIDIYGKTLMFQTYNTENIKIDISKYNTGLYLLRITDNKGNVVKIEKIVKK